MHVHVLLDLRAASTSILAVVSVSRGAVMCVTWLRQMCDMLPSHVSRDARAARAHSLTLALIRKRRHGHTAYMAYGTYAIYVWRDRFVAVTWLIQICAMTHANGWHETWLMQMGDKRQDSLICVTWLYVPWLIDMTDMTQAHQDPHAHTHTQDSVCVNRQYVKETEFPQKSHILPQKSSVFPQRIPIETCSAMSVWRCELLLQDFSKSPIFPPKSPISGISSSYLNISRETRALLREYRALLRAYRTLLRECRTVWKKFNAVSGGQFWAHDTPFLAQESPHPISSMPNSPMFPQKSPISRKRALYCRQKDIYLSHRRRDPRSHIELCQKLESSSKTRSGDL